MEIIELIDIISRGEDSKHQFKKYMTNAGSLASEMVAFSNSDGGMLLIGVDDNGNIIGLNSEELRKLNELISNVASQNVKPSITPTTENVQTEKGLVVIVKIPEGLNKPYQDNSGYFWKKSGSDKRRVDSREELQRMFQQSNLVHADIIPVKGATIADIDIDYFKEFFGKHFSEALDEQSLPLQSILENMNLAKDGTLTIAGTLLFAKTVKYKLPVFMIKAGAFDALELSTSEYSDSKDLSGKLADVFRQSVNFIVTNLRHVQGRQNVNSTGMPEIPAESIEEIVANALVHRDYFISAPIRIFVFRDRVEIISPGHLPNNLTVENIKSGNSNSRNPVLASYANHVLPYRGYGSGIIRALASYPHIDFEDDRDGNMFKVTFWRKS
ncbi:MAG: putative DNA binding domain-containing protein [Oscillospiraceae bacterium]|nr:putative DNA binding domain-containing protein [Oscillospiraceae bacterium]MCL2279888.1 putative DNA binding domain-containing protein [Oscillospiraceae bacterium]